MMPTDSNLAGKVLREHVAVETDATSHALRRARLVTAATAPRTSRMPMTVAAAFGVAAVAVVLLLWVRSGDASDPLTFTVGPDIRTGQVGIYYAATPDAELPLRFSDGSQVSVQPRGGVRVHETGQKRVAVFVETGRARFDVAHRPEAGWEIAAGPYSVRVTGTAFDLSWTPESRSFELAMRSGAVTVRGPGIESGVVVKGTERFVSRVTADVKRPHPAASATGPSNTASSDALDETKLDEPKLDEPRLPKAPSGAEKPPSANALPEKPGASWSELAAKGDYASIVRAAEDRGIDRAIAGASADELRALADAARFSGRPALAQRALLAIRSRFAGTKAATGAAFVLGRMVDGSDARAAVTWYDRYLAEGGPLAAEAQGRRMLALRRSPYSRQARELSR
jgi:hypothetical protein